ncbi:hypothetical protein EJB05_17053 [Eragrostis curvula]|uniref:Uncharacterized protein n=1 Tax=Eragrostis curvula TaxID=38414 RepID=A0A5J9VHU3_9POAL|nr:hypothetical protein EJB05_17053 [Eragrostis curvula]
MDDCGTALLLNHSSVPRIVRKPLRCQAGPTRPFPRCAPWGIHWVPPTAGCVGTAGGQKFNGVVFPLSMQHIMIKQAFVLR